MAGSQYKKIAVNTLYQFGSRGLSVLLSLASVGLLTRYLGAEKYGWFTLVFTYISFFTTLGDVGYNQTIVREYSRDEKRSKDIYASLFNLKLILITISAALAVTALIFFPYDAHLKTAILIGIVAVAVSNLTSYGTSILQSQLKLDIVSLLDIGIKALTVGLIAIFISWKLDFYYLIGSILIGNLAGLLVEYVFVKDWITFKLYIDLVLVRRILKISIPVGITTFLSLLYFKVDTLILSVMRTPTEVGIYGLSYKVLDNILMLWALFMASVFPLLAKYFGNKDASKYKDLLIKTLLLSVGMSVVIIVSGNVFSYTIMRILGGSKFFSSMAPFKILLMAVPFLFLNNIFFNVILSFGKTKYLIIPLVLALVVNIAANLFAIPRFGYIGASYTTIVTEAFTSITYTYILLTKFKKEASYLVSV